VSTSCRTWKPNWRSTILIGTWPGRKPCIFTVRRQLLQPRRDLGFDLGDRDRDGQVALEGAWRVLDCLCMK
jgi:hypothetical protein